ncbi:hypothetical protein E1B28_009181 [Marasmius oreades]|uniref:Uncharacterized protein n=1 Tax=Marasmius oreades TaxID=181124 RepID=A0A9P7UV19_9AGAR|nr:uncharacterized protein E1B28_009181 [Marasmius oreades]KAG7092869.1 hypothetical protein E1B28_009181 [Marasmius oreades]
MTSICLSSAPNLRCFPFSKNEYIAITVPTGLEIIFSSYLIFVNRGPGRKNLFLAAEGWFYFALALLEMLLHILPAARDNPNASRIIDITLGAASSVPLLLYTIFLFLFTSAETIDVVPVRFQKIGKALLIVFIPLLIASNAVASFAGITHRLVLLNGLPTLVIQVINELIHTFFSSFAVALLTAYQAINFSFAFIRLAIAFINSRRIERDSADEVVLFKGTGWITGGLKLGAIETVIGFAGPGFGTSLVRRIFRLLARAFLVIGLVKGVDFSEDFRLFQSEMAHRRRKSKSGTAFRRSLRPFISNPRFSTFRQLSPTATSFHHGTSSPLLPGLGSGERRISAMDTFAAIKETVQNQRTHQRVTIHFDAASGRAPTLEMRFSRLEMPNPALIVDSVKAPTSEWMTRRASSTWYSPSVASPNNDNYSDYHNHPFSFDETSMPDYPTVAAAAASTSRSAAMPNSATSPSLSIRNAFLNMSTSTTDLGHGHSHSRVLSEMSSYSLTRSVVNEFPEIPQPPSNEELRKAIRGRNEDDPPSGTGTVKSGEAGTGTGTGTLSASSSFKRKPVPVYVPEPLDPFEDDDMERMERERRSMDETDTPLQTGVATEYTFGSPKRRSTDNDVTPRLDTRQMGSPASSLTPTPFSATSSFGNDFVEDVNSAPYTRAFSSSQSIPSGGRIVSISPSEMLPLPPVEEEYEYPRSVLEGSRRVAFPDSAVPPRRNSSNYRGKSMDTIDLSWLNSTGGSVSRIRDSLNTYEGEVKVERATRTRAHQSKPSLTRIKSVGRAPRRYTPTPERTEFVTRGSVYVEPIVIPPRDKEMVEVEVIQGSSDSQLGGALRDSSVFGGNVYVRKY